MKTPSAQDFLSSLYFCIRLYIGPDTPLSVRTAAWYLDVGVDHIYKLTQRNEIAFHCPGGKRLYFLRADLDAYALQRRRKSIGDLERAADDLAHLA